MLELVFLSMRLSGSSSSDRVRESGRVGEGAREESRLPPIASALSHVNPRAASPHLDTRLMSS
jgi:hypothetical protein